MKKQYDYHVALSFAGEDRIYVEEVANILKSDGIKVFYDKFEETILWGKNLLDYLQEIYKNKAQYTVMFISEHYARKAWTTHERKSMQERAFTESEEYILPARFDLTEIPGLASTVSYIDLNFKTPVEFANMIKVKIGWHSKTRWFGRWSFQSPMLCHWKVLMILNIKESEFNFRITAMNGSFAGDIEGVAKIYSNNEAEYISSITNNEKELPCTLKFFKQNDIIQLSEINGLHCDHGLGVSFNGDYELQKDIFYDIVELNDNTLSSIYKALLQKGAYWLRFLRCFGKIYDEDNLDTFDAKVISGHVPGTRKYYKDEAILMYSEQDNQIWGAIFCKDNLEAEGIPLDGFEYKKIYYFSSDKEYINKLPQTIAHWVRNFEDSEIVLLNE